MTDRPEIAYPWVDWFYSEINGVEDTKDKKENFSTFSVFQAHYAIVNIYFPTEYSGRLERSPNLLGL